jgi:hypothetical protein
LWCGSGANELVVGVGCRCRCYKNCTLTLAATFGVFPHRFHRTPPAAFSSTRPRSQDLSTQPTARTMPRNRLHRFETLEQMHPHHSTAIMSWGEGWRGFGENGEVDEVAVRQAPWVIPTSGVLQLLTPHPPARPQRSSPMK